MTATNESGEARTWSRGQWRAGGAIVRKLVSRGKRAR